MNFDSYIFVFLLLSRHISYAHLYICIKDRHIVWQLQTAHLLLGVNKTSKTRRGVYRVLRAASGNEQHIDTVWNPRAGSGTGSLESIKEALGLKPGDLTNANGPILMSLDTELWIDFTGSKTGKSIGTAATVIGFSFVDTQKLKCDPPSLEEAISHMEFLHLRVAHHRLRLSDC
ncbi:hypothetical protein BT63DRAFT_450811 [Microthyrium microscopicum]|uniref:Uncharacterized protein n=1 Tax=Microthyrium microscopicum TaxID=703497 RepID=A0A6A6UMW9_9PEZI|nr:hypothetical protein BT63DRAFT_450811 [Microthyrium microscopicum]